MLVKQTNCSQTIILFISSDSESIWKMVAKFTRCQEVDKRRSFVSKLLQNYKRWDIVHISNENENESEDDFDVGGGHLWSPLNMV